jgi:multidrug efflux pump subunit AcrB
MIGLAVDVDRENGSAARDASYQGWLLLLREIIVITPAAILGMLPLMLGTGMGSQPCRLVARAVVRPVLPPFIISYFYFDRPAGGGPFE